MITTAKLADHVEFYVHEWIIPLLGESKRTAGETGDEDDDGPDDVTSSLCPYLGTIRRSDIDGKGGSNERECGEK